VGKDPDVCEFLRPLGVASLLAEKNIIRDLGSRKRAREDAKLLDERIVRKWDKFCNYSRKV